MNKKFTRTIRKLKYVLATFMLIAILSSFNVGVTLGSPDTSIALTPSACSGWPDPDQDGDPPFSHVLLNIEVSDVVDLYSYQCYATFDTSVLNFYAAYEGPFLKGDPSDEWESSAWDDMRSGHPVTGEAVGTGDSATTVFHLDHSPVETGSETIMLDSVPQTGNEDYVIDYNTGEITFEIPVSNEAVGTGDNVTHIFYLDNSPVELNSEVIRLAGEILTRNVNYTIDYNTGKITFPEVSVTGEAVGTGDGSTTVFYLDHSPVKLNSETIKLDGSPTSNYVINYTAGEISFGVSVTGEAVGTGDGSTTVFYLDHVPVKLNSETIKLDGSPTSDYVINYTAGEITFEIPVSNEAVGTGDSVTTVFYLDHVPVKPNSETIKLDGVPTSDYVINYTTGEITFNTPPSFMVAITADYVYLQPPGAGVAITADYFYLQPPGAGIAITADYVYTEPPETGEAITASYTYLTTPGTGVAITADYTYYLAANPHYARDMDVNPYWDTTYSLINFSEADGYLAIGNCSREPWGTLGASPYSKVERVDLKVKYSATASTLGDQYRIVYYSGTPDTPGTKIVLVDWTSNAAALETYTWVNALPPPPPAPEQDNGKWDWDDLWHLDPSTGLPTSPERGLHIAVETNRVGGDPNANVFLYEAWATVTYTRPTFSVLGYSNSAGYVSFGSTTLHLYPGISGSGVLGSIEFIVIGTGEVTLNINLSPTYLEDSNGQLITCSKLSSHYYPPIDEDVNGDGFVDIMDLTWVAMNYGKTGTYPNPNIWPPQADVNKDGDITIVGDLARIAAKYGYSYE